MIERISVIAIAIFIGACASSAPEAPAPATNVDAAAANADPAPAEGEIYDLDAPNVEQTAAVAKNEEDEIVCRREIITGTRMSHRVCRRRSDMEAAEEDSQEALRKMRGSGSQMERDISN